jgi:quercetin dioxygenase-like cupin family protein
MRPTRSNRSTPATLAPAFALAFALAFTLALTACTGAAPSTAPAAMGEPASPAPTEVIKQVLGTTDPSTAKGQELYLYTVLIPAGAAIPPHTHPGPQLGHIEEGTLTYTVIDGEVTVLRAAGTPEESTETIEAPATTELHVGDTVIEEPGMVHGAANDGEATVRVLLSSLFPIGAELSSPVSVPSPAA